MKPRRAELIVALMATPVAAWWSLASYTGESGLVHTGDDQVAVVVDYITGEQAVVTTPGYRIHVPHFQQIHVFDRRPIEFSFKGNADEYQPNLFPRLTVRANDGSSFWFDDFKLQYALIPERSVELLADSGPGHGFKVRLVNAFARAVLRDELGRFSAEEVVLPENVESATLAAKRRLNELLEPHAVQVLEVGKPKPRFHKDYEHAIERRKVANQEIEHLRGKREQLQQEKAQRIASVRGKKEAELRSLEGNLAQQILGHEQESIRIVNEANIYHLHRTGDGALTRQRKEAEAGALVETYTKQAEGLVARTRALELQGEQAVRAALIDRLPKIEFSLMPYARDSRPKLIEYGEARAGALP